MAEDNFLGMGMKFPPQVNPATGRFAVSLGAHSVKESIYLILMTQKTERMVRPSFGSDMMEYTFMDMTETMMTMLARDIRSDILTQEPRVSEVEIEMKPVPARGLLMVDISYTIQGGHTKDSVVFPFYLDAGTEGEEDEEMDRIQSV